MSSASSKSKARMRGFTAIPGPSGAPPTPPADPLAWLVNRLQEDENGQPLMEGIFSNYNDDIVMEADPNTLLGRYDPVRGPVQRLEIGDGLRIENGVIIGEGGGEKGDPGPPGPEGPVGPQGPAGASSSMWLYRFDSATSAMDPGAGRLRYNNTTTSAVTRIYFDRLTQDGLDPTIAFTTAKFDDEFVIQRRGMSAQNQTFRMLAPAIDRTDWFELWVEYTGQVGQNFSNNMEVTVILRTRGQPGPVGPQGPVGPVGPQGPQGFQGSRGDTGPIGPVGAQGPQGVKGDKGDQGIVGPVGATGPQGIKGDTGNQGAKGDKGDQGVIGPTGNTGATGPQGIQGEKGDPGSLGADEAPSDGQTYGRKNEAWSLIEASGARVSISDNPPLNPKIGDMWFEADSGFMFVFYDDGTSSQWVVSTPVAGMGPQGIQGIQGVKGDQGDQGIQGVQGPVGPVGPQGLKGDQGYQGVQGPKGDPGDLTDAPNDGKMYARKSAVWAEVASATAAEYLANSAPTKLLTSGAAWSAMANLDVSGTDIAGVLTLDFSKAFDFWYYVSAAGKTLANPINAKVGQRGTILLSNSATASITTWGSRWKFSGGIKPTLTPNAVDLLSYWVQDPANYIYCTIGPDFK
jgi:hypothetical protein